MWELTSARDWQLAEALMPKGNWPSTLGALFCEDELLGHVLKFRASVEAIGAVELQSNPDLTALVAAFRVVRIHEDLGRGACADLHMLLRGCLALPGAQDALGRHGIAEQMSAWLEVRFKHPPGFVDPKSRAGKESWMHDTSAFYKASERTNLLRDHAGEALRAWLFKA
jgi:hypothetical protein